MASWRYVFADLRTDRTIDELDLSSPTFDVRINEGGIFSGTAPIPNRSIAQRVAQIEEGRTVVYAYRDADIWAGPYLLWQLTPAADDRGRITAALQGAELPSYLGRREIREDLAYDDVDQLDIARDLVSLAQQQRPAGDLGIYVDATDSGILRDRAYYASDGGTYGQRLKELAEVENGFEYRISAFIDPQTRQRIRVLQLGYPTLGQDNTEHVFAQPGNVLSWSRIGDATNAATSFRARGDSITDDLTARQVALMSDVVDRDDLLEAGWPVLDRTEDFQSVTVKATLDQYAQARAAQRGGSTRILSVKVRLDPGAEAFSPASLGDRARIILSNDWFTPQLSESWRVVGMGITPATRGSGQDVAQLIFENTDAGQN